jgi:predicted nicotinamide N-methyase
MVTATVAQQSWEELSQRYNLEWADIQVGQVKLKILQIRDLEDYLVSNIEAQGLSLENFPYWAMVWDAALVLADFLVKQEPQPDRQILELGAGLGFAGLCAAAWGHRVTITDNMPDALAFARLSMHHNNLTNVEVAYLDWTAPSLEGKFDWIVGSDILYEQKNFEPLLKVLVRYLKPGGKIYLTQGIRGTGPKAFFDLIRENYTVRYQEKKLHSGEEEKKILFFELQPKKVTS